MQGIKNIVSHHSSIRTFLNMIVAQIAPTDVHPTDRSQPCQAQNAVSDACKVDEKHCIHSVWAFGDSERASEAVARSLGKLVSDHPREAHIQNKHIFFTSVSSELRVRWGLWMTHLCLPCYIVTRRTQNSGTTPPLISVQVFNRLRRDYLCWWPREVLLLSVQSTATHSHAATRLHKPGAAGTNLQKTHP